MAPTYLTMSSDRESKVNKDLPGNNGSLLCAVLASRKWSVMLGMATLPCSGHPCRGTQANWGNGGRPSALRGKKFITAGWQKNTPNLWLYTVLCTCTRHRGNLWRLNVYLRRLSVCLWRLSVYFSRVLRQRSGSGRQYRGLPRHLFSRFIAGKHR